MEYSFYDFLKLLGSLALFLYGMKIMSEGLQKFAGDRLRKILTAMTTNRVTGVLTGVLITALVQSSSATTVMVVSFVNAGLLTLSQSIGVIMGANIGTTVTAWIISALGFKVDIAAFALPLLAFGIPLLFSQKSNRKSVGEFIFGFSFLFMGLSYLKNNAPDLSIAIRKYLDENAGLKKQVEDFMKEKEAALKERLLKNVQEIHGIKVIKFCSPLPAEVVKNIAFQLRGEITENLFFVAGSTDNGKPMLTVMLSDNLVAGGLKAGNLVKEAAKLIQGGGGGQPHFATAGGKNADGLPAAVEKVLELAGI